MALDKVPCDLSWAGQKMKILPILGTVSIRQRKNIFYLEELY